MKQPQRHYKMGEEPHDEAAYQGGNIGPDVDVPEPQSTLGVQLVISKGCVQHARDLVHDLDRFLSHDVTPGRLHVVAAHLRAKLKEADESLEKALWHYDYDKPAWQGGNVPKETEEENNEHDDGNETLADQQPG